MHLFFIKKHIYLIPESKETVRIHLEEIFDRKPPSKYENITGNFGNDESFIIEHKWSIGGFMGKFTSDPPVYFSGHLEGTGKSTKVFLESNPNILYIIAFYFCVVAVFSLILIGENRLERYSPFAIGLLISYLICEFAAFGLRRRFERLMDCKMYEV